MGIFCASGQFHSPGGCCPYWTGVGGAWRSLEGCDGLWVVHALHLQSYLLRRYLHSPNLPQTPSQKVLGGPGIVHACYFLERPFAREFKKEDPHEVHDYPRPSMHGTKSKKMH